MLGYLNLIHAASIPPYEPPKAIIGHDSHFIYSVLYQSKNSEKSAKAYSVVKYCVVEEFINDYKPKGKDAPKYLCSANIIIALYS